MYGEGNFLELYLQYTKGQESPDDFHYWSAVGCVASVLGRNVWLDQGFTTVYPNQYIVLVADSALARKSTAFAKIAVPHILRPTLEILKDLHMAAGTPRVIATKITPEKLIDLMEWKKPYWGETKMDFPIPTPALLVASELGVFMSKYAIQSGMTDILMDLYDNPDFWEYATKTQGEYILRNITVSFLAATTPDWLAGNIITDLFNQGLVGRTIFVYAPGPKGRIPRPVRTAKEIVLQDQLQDRLKGISYLRGAFTLDDDAGRKFDSWYLARSEPVASDDGGFFGREHEHILKLALVLSATRRTDKRITLQEITEAIERMAKIRLGLPMAFRDVRYGNELPDMKYLEGKIAEHQPISRTDLLRKVYRRMDQKALDTNLGSLMAAGVVRVREEGAEGKKKKRVYELG